MEQKSNFFKETVKFALLVLVIVVPVRLYIAQPFIVNGSSMDPTFATGQYLIIDEISYRFAEPTRGDVIVFRYPNNPKQFFIKRVIGLPSETIAFTNSEVQIRNEKHPDGLTLEEPYADAIPPPTYDNQIIALKQDEYFVMGDNRASSFDSRRWGPLRREQIIGRAILRLYPFNTLDIYPGNYSDSL
jgi:signal peptidase I